MGGYHSYPAVISTVYSHTCRCPQGCFRLWVFTSYSRGFPHATQLRLFAKTSINSPQNFWELLGYLSHSAFILQLPSFDGEPHRNSKTLHSQFLPRSPASLSTEGYWRLDGAHRCIERHFLDFVSLFLSTEEVTLFCS